MVPSAFNFDRSVESEAKDSPNFTIETETDRLAVVLVNNPWAAKRNSTDEWHTLCHLKNNYC